MVCPRLTGRARARAAQLALRPIAWCVMLACVDPAWANPTGAQVAAGAAALQAVGKTLNITNTPGTIINWRGFSIGSGEHTRFLQPSAASAVLNRVVGSDASSILGTLSSNGRVFLINPHGIVFGAGAVIDTAGFIASTLNMADRDFLAGRFKFDGGGNGVLRNEGTIRASGDILLVGPQIENAGLIRSDGGDVLLAAGKSVTVTSPDAQGVRFAIQAPEDAVLNLGSIKARNAVRLFAGTLRHSGYVRAGGASMTNAGRVMLTAQKDTVVEAGAHIDASGGHGGHISIQSGDTTLVAGSLDASGSAGQGGTVHILGNLVGLTGNANVNASGETGGGTILVGGDVQGGNPGVQNAWRTFVGADTTLRADALTSSDGGKVIVWSDDITRHYGSISARGGAQSGNGGFVEVSGKRFLDFRGAADTRAPKGRAGTLLLDATDTDVVAVGSGLPLTEFAGGLFQEAGVIDPTSEITTDALLNALLGGDVVISTQSAAGSPGNINFMAPFNFNGVGVNRKLELRANNNVNISNSIFDGGANGDALTLVLNTGGVTNITADVLLGGGLLDAATAGSGIVNISAGTPLIGGAFNAGTLNVSGGIASLAGPLGAAALNLTAGILDARSGNLPRLNMTGGVLTRTTPGDLTIAGPFNVSGGVIGFGGAGDALLTLGVTTVTGVVNPLRDWTNSGALSLNAGGQLSPSPMGDFVFTNFGTVNINNDATVMRPFSEIPAPSDARIVNFGVFNKNAGAAESEIAHPFNNVAGATINVNAGTLRLTSMQTPAGGAQTQSGTIRTAAGTTFSTGGNDLTNRATGEIGGLGTVDLGGAPRMLTNNGTLVPGGSGAPPGGALTGTFTIGGDLAQGAGGAVEVLLAGTAAGSFDRLSVTGTAALAGTLDVTAGGGFVPASGDTFAVITAPTVTGTFGTITRPSPFNEIFPAYNATNVVLTLGLVNRNTWLFDGSGSWTDTARWSQNRAPIATDEVVIDRPAGVFTITVPAGAFSADRLMSQENITIAGTLGLADQSTIDATLAINGGTLQGAGPVTVNGPLSLDAGTVASTAGVTVNPLFATGVSGGASQLTGRITTSALDMTSGSLGIGAAGVLGLVGFGAKTVSGATLTNAGTVTLDGTASLVLNNAAQVTNTGTFNIAGLFVVVNNLGIRSTAGAAPTFTNNGLLAKTAGRRNSVIGGGNAFNFVNSGVLDARIGTLEFASNNTFNDGTRFIGAGSNLVTSDSTFNGTITSNGLTLQSGIFGGAAAFAGTTAWSGGTLSGAFTIPPGATLNVTGGGATTFAAAASLANAGTINFAGSQTIGAPFSNTGTVNIDAGTLSLGGNGTDTGTYAIDAGTSLDLTGGTRNFNDTITLSGAGRIRSFATLNLNAPLTQSSGAFALHLNDGVLTNPLGLTLNGEFNWSGGAMIGAGTLTTGATSATSVSGTATLSGKLWENFGPITLTDVGQVVLAGAAAPAPATTFINRGTGVITDTSLSALPITTGAAPRANKLFANAGTFDKNAGSAATQTIDAPFTNTGLVNVRTGTLEVNGFPTNNGTIDVAGGATFSTLGTAFTNGALGVLRGTGTFSVGAATLTNDGLIAPADSPGTLTIAGNFAQGAGGVLAIELGGTTAGAEHDVLAITGAATLGGTLSVSTLGAFTGTAGDVFDVITYASRTGDFAVVSLPAGSEVQAAPNPAFYRLAVATPPTERQQQEAQMVASNDVVVLSDRASDTVTGQEQKEEEKKGAASQECR